MLVFAFDNYPLTTTILRTGWPQFVIGHQKCKVGIILQTAGCIERNMMYHLINVELFLIFT